MEALAGDLNSRYNDIVADNRMLIDENTRAHRDIRELRELVELLAGMVMSPEG